MIKTEKYDNKLLQRVETTVRDWVTPNGHKVTVTTRKSINTNTIMSRLNRFHTTHYKCECGKKFSVYNKGAKKVELANHDNWHTQEESDALTAQFMKFLEA